MLTSDFSLTQLTHVVDKPYDALLIALTIQ